MNRRNLFMSLWAVVAAPLVGSKVLASDGPEECLLEMSGLGWREITTTKGIAWHAGKIRHWTPFMDEKEAIQVARKFLKLFRADQSGNAVLIRLHGWKLED